MDFIESEEMAISKTKYKSINISRFLITLAGFWSVNTLKERVLLNALLVYTIIAILLAVMIEAYDFYVSIGDFYAMTYVSCSAMPVIITTLKLFILLPRREDIRKLIKFTENNFWFAKTNEHIQKVLNDVDSEGIIMIIAFTFFVTGTVLTYIIAPLIENIGKNESDRILPFNMWMGDIELSSTPYFEVAFTLQTIAAFYTGLCFCCFDNFLCLLNLHTAAQFRILQHRLETIFDEDSREDKEYLHFSKNERQSVIQDKFKECVKQHMLLFTYVNDMEKIFSTSILCQLILSSVILCVTGFQVLLARGTYLQTITMFSNANGSLFQIFLITFAANKLTEDSYGIKDAAYKANWISSSYGTNKEFRIELLIIMQRTERSTYLTAGGFFPVSLEMFMTVLSTSASYFALLRKFLEDVENIE